MPALDCRIIPARSINRCETIWASLGFSRNKGRKYSESRIEPHPWVGRRTLGKTQEPVHRACRWGFDCRDRAGVGSAVERTKVGRVAPPLPFPAALGNSGKNFFPRLAPKRKVFIINIL